MIARVYNSAKKSRRLDNLFVATDDDRIAETVRQFGGQVIITGSNHPTGTDRVSEAVGLIENKTGKKADLVVNIQGDEPLIPADVIDKIVDLLDSSETVMSTACAVIENPADIDDPDVVKVVKDRNYDAIYFSRSRIPFIRKDESVKIKYLRHIGIYGFKREFLMRYSTMTRGALEIAESLEQLRALEHGFKIKIAEVKFDFVEIDTKEDIVRAERIIAERGD